MIESSEGLDHDSINLACLSYGGARHVDEALGLRAVADVLERSSRSTVRSKWLAAFSPSL